MKTIISTSVIAIIIGVGLVSFNKDSRNSVVDSYKVIKVDGKIVFTKTGKNMLTGDSFSINEQLNFITQESRAAVISATGGRFVLTPNAIAGKASNLLPAMSNVATRSGSLLNALDLKTFFSERILLLDEMEVKIDNKEYPLNDVGFFYLKYVFEGDTIAKKLPNINKRLVFSPKEIYKIDGNVVPIPNEAVVNLYYSNVETGKGIYISTFTLAMPIKEELIKEISVIKKSMINKSNDDFTNEVDAFLAEFYGKVDNEALKKWLKENI